MGGRYWGAWTIDPTVSSVMGYVALAATLYFFVSPLSTAVRITKEKDTLDFNPAVYITQIINCSFWVGYAFFQGNLLQPLVTNITGAAAGFIWLVHFLCYAKRPQFLDTLGKFIAILLAESLTIAALRYWDTVDFFQGQSRSVFILGLLADLCNVALYASPLAVIRTVIKTQSVEFMPLPVCLGVGGCSLCWMVYGIYMGDVFVTTPNVLGTLLSLFQLVLHSRYGKGRVLDSDREMYQSLRQDD